MAIIKSVAIGKAKGSIQNVTYAVVGGDTVGKGKVAFPKNPKTLGQMARRVRWANLVGIWQAFTERDKPSFEDKAPRVSDFNAFIGANIGGVPVYLTKDEAAQGASVAAAYTITSGSLPTIEIVAGTGGAPVTDINLGTLTIDGDVTLQEFSEAVINNNPRFVEGDQITFFYLRQELNSVSGIPYVLVESDKVTLNTRNEDTLLADVIAAATGFTTVDGKLGMNGTANGAVAWVHTRIDADGTVKVSKQTLYVTNTILAQYQTAGARTAAIISYGGKTQSAYLRPDVDAAISGN